MTLDIGGTLLLSIVIFWDFLQEWALPGSGRHCLSGPK